MLLKPKSLALFLASASLTIILSTSVFAMELENDAYTDFSRFKKKVFISRQEALSNAAENVKREVTTEIKKVIMPNNKFTPLINKGLNNFINCIVNHIFDFAADEPSTGFTSFLPENGLSKLKVETELLLNKHISYQFQEVRLLENLASGCVYGALSAIVWAFADPYSAGAIAVVGVADIGVSCFSNYGGYAKYGLRSVFGYNNWKIDILSPDATLEHYGLKPTEDDKIKAESYNKNGASGYHEILRNAQGT